MKLLVGPSGPLCRNAAKLARTVGKKRPSIRALNFYKNPLRSAKVRQSQLYNFQTVRGPVSDKRGILLAFFSFSEVGSLHLCAIILTSIYFSCLCEFMEEYKSDDEVLVSPENRNSDKAT